MFLFCGVTVCLKSYICDMIWLTQQLNSVTLSLFGQFVALKVVLGSEKVGEPCVTASEYYILPPSLV